MAQFLGAVRNLIAPSGQRPGTSQPRAAPWVCTETRNKALKGRPHFFATPFQGFVLFVADDPGLRSCLACPGLACLRTFGATSFAKPKFRTGSKDSLLRKGVISCAVQANVPERVPMPTLRAASRLRGGGGSSRPGLGASAGLPAARSCQGRFQGARNPAAVQRMSSTQLTDW